MDSTELVERASALAIAIQLGNGSRAKLWPPEAEPADLNEVLKHVHARAHDLLSELCAVKLPKVEPNPFLPNNELRCAVCIAPLVVLGFANTLFMSHWGRDPDVPLTLHFQTGCENQCQETMWVCQFPPDWNGGSNFNINISLTKAPDWNF